MRAWRQGLLIFLFLIPTIFAVYWTMAGAAAAWLASSTLVLPTELIRDSEDSSTALNLQRHIQKHFLQFDIYIPTEDIVYSPDANRSSSDLALLMQKACGRGKLYIWVPLRFRLPLVGEKITEWCWKPQIKPT